MTQIFFLAPDHATVENVAKAHPVHGFHMWHDNAHGQVIGVVEVQPHGDTEAVALALEAGGAVLFPNHLTGGKVPKHISDRLGHFGVKENDSVHDTMHRLHKATHPLLRPRRY